MLFKGSEVKKSLGSESEDLLFGDYVCTRGKFVGSAHPAAIPNCSTLVSHCRACAVMLLPDTFRKQSHKPHSSHLGL